MRIDEVMVTQENTAKPDWMKDFEEAKAEEMKNNPKLEGNSDDSDDDSDSDDETKLSRKPIGPVCPTKCSATGNGVAGGAAGSAVSLVLVAKDEDGRRLPSGGAKVVVKVSPGPGVDAAEQLATVRDNGEGTYTATYTVSARGNYTVTVTCNNEPILGSPFPVFFGAGSTVPATVSLPAVTATNSTSMGNISTSAGLVGNMGILGPSPFAGIPGGILTGLWSRFLDFLPFYLAILPLFWVVLLPGGALTPAAAAMAAAQSIRVAQALKQQNGGLILQEKARENELFGRAFFSLEISSLQTKIKWRFNISSANLPV